MTQTIAIEIDHPELRVAVVEKGPAGPAVQALRMLDISSAAQPEQQAAMLEKELPDVRWSRATLVGVVGGDQLLCRMLKLPPSPDAELPEMVRLQAAREFAADEKATVVDFVPLSGDESTPHSVLAAVVDNDTFAALKALAKALDAPLDRLVARGFGAASLALRLSPECGEGAHLVVAAAPDGADLTVLEDGGPSLVRSARIREDAPDQAVAAEVRRTTAMAAQQIGRRLDSVVVLGYSPSLPNLATTEVDVVGRLRGEFGLPSEATADVTKKLTGSIGAALDGAEDVTPAIDFMHPRKAPKDTSSRRRMIVLGSAAAVLLVAGVLFAYSRLWRLEQQIESANTLLASKQEVIDQWQPQMEQAAQIERWMATDVDWLDELDWLSKTIRTQPLSAEEFPAEADAYLRQFVATEAGDRNAAAAGGGRMDLTTRARSYGRLGQIEGLLRDERHVVDPGPTQDVPDGGAYIIQATQEVRVMKPTEGAEQ